MPAPRLGFSVFCLVLAGLATLPSCSRTQPFPPVSAEDSIAIVRDNLDHRASVDSSFRTDPGSPFRRDSSITFTGIRWFPVDPRYRVTSVLHPYDTKDTVTVYGTKGEPRRQLRYGYFEFVLPDSTGSPVTVRLNAYKFTPYDGNRYALFKDHLSVWFTDRTTGRETYHVGRYLEVGLHRPDPAHVYVLDFNKAYNPYCAYSSLFSCAIPRDEDRLNVALLAGERLYHE